MHPRLALSRDGVSEYTFSNLYLFRRRYNYRISWIEAPHKTFVLSGEREGKRFFMTPCAAPETEILAELFRTHDYWKGIPPAVLEESRDRLLSWGLRVEEDRDNFDYLYFRTDLAELSGKKYHKKRNMVNAFTSSYRWESRPLTPELVPEARRVLERWRRDKGEVGDYVACSEALDLLASLHLKGALYYVEGRPAAWCLGESLARGRMFAVHFEKALDDYKGIYQFINQDFAASLPSYYTYINREQDLGDEGLRQAKMTYRPADFVRKYTGSFSK